MDRLIKLCKTSELPEGHMKTFNVNGMKVLLINLKGVFYAFEDRCTHMGYPLSLGSLSGKTITCGFHYAKFDVTDGKPLSPPASKPLKVYKTVLKNDEVFVYVNE